jgi:hypothetical protein
MIVIRCPIGYNLSADGLGNASEKNNGRYRVKSTHNSPFNFCLAAAIPLEMHWRWTTNASCRRACNSMSMDGLEIKIRKNAIKMNKF